MTERDRVGHDLDLEHILPFERRWEGKPGNREAAIRESFGCSAARYYQALNALIDTPEALTTDPMLVRRLQRLRDQRWAAREAMLRRPHRLG